MDWRAYTCILITCDAYGQEWPVEVDDQGVPVDEAEARCPECLGAGREVRADAAAI